MVEEMEGSPAAFFAPCRCHDDVELVLAKVAAAGARAGLVDEVALLAAPRAEVVTADVVVLVRS